MEDSFCCSIQCGAVFNLACDSDFKTQIFLGCPSFGKNYYKTFEKTFIISDKSRQNAIKHIFTI